MCKTTHTTYEYKWFCRCLESSQYGTASILRPRLQGNLNRLAANRSCICRRSLCNHITYKCNVKRCFSIVTCAPKYTHWYTSFWLDRLSIRHCTIDISRLHLYGNLGRLAANHFCKCTLFLHVHIIKGREISSHHKKDVKFRMCLLLV